VKPKLLVIELWGIGDLTIGTPFLRAACERYDVTLLAKPYATDLQVRLWPAVKVVPFTAPWTAFRHKYRLLRWPWREMFRLWRKLREERFAVGLSARWDPRDHALLQLCRVKSRLGFPRMGSGHSLTEPLARPDPEAHRYEHWRVIAQALNLRLPPREQIPFPEGRRNGVVLVHSGAGQAVRVWPLERYRRLVARLRARNYTVQVACDADQEVWWQQVGEKGVTAPRTVTELLALTDRAGVFIGNDSGPGHVAAFNGVPTLTLFGPQLPEWFAPLHPASEWLEGRACPYKPCSDYCRFALPHCVWDLSEETVWSKVEAFVARHGGRLEKTAAPALVKVQPTYRTARPLHFLQIFNRYLMPGGEQNSVARIASHLELAGHQATRYWRASAEWFGPDAPPKWRQFVWTWQNTPLLNQLREVHLRVRPDAWILHNLVPLISPGVYRLAIELDVPVIRWLHNYRPISPSGTLRAWGKTLEPDDPWLKWKEAWAGTWHGRVLTAWLALCYMRVTRRRDLEAVDAWVALSEEMRRIFIRGGFPAKRIHVLRHSWDIQPPVRLGADAGYFLYLGRMVEEKGVRFLLRLWQRPELKDILLVMAGVGPVADSYRGQRPPNIRWVGFVSGEEKRRLVAGCRAVLFPCLWPEPLGTVVYEAYEQGRPVLASDLGGLKDLVMDHQTGRLLAPGSEAVWIEAIQQLVRNPQMSRAMGERGLRWLNEHVSPAEWNRQFDEILYKVIS